jgi:hypothetical protein
MANASIYYFENDHAVECQNSSKLTNAANNTSLNVPKADMKKSLRSLLEVNRVRGSVEYPFLPKKNVSSEPAHSGGEVNFFNCLNIFYSYVQAVMKQSVVPEEHLLTYREEITCEFLHSVATTLISVSYPSPEGVCVVTSQVVDDFWGNVKVSDVVVPADRMQKLSNADIEKRKMVYVAVILLHRGGLLDAANAASARAVSETKNACKAYLMMPKINITKRLHPDSLQT